MSISDNYIPLKQLGNGVTTEFSDSWAVLNASYIRVYLEDVSTGVQTLQTLGSDYTLTFTGSGFTVTFTTAPTSANNVVIGRQVEADQSVPFKTSKGFQGGVTENAFDKLTAIDQDQQDEINRALKFPLGSSLIGVLPAVAVDGYGIVFDGTTGKFRSTTSNVDTIVTDATAQANAAAASAVTAASEASDATTQAATATSQAAIATAQAAAATAAVESAPFRDVVNVTFADSPYTVYQGHNGTFFSVDTSGGDVVFDLQEIGSLTLPYNLRFKKETTDSNSVTINRGGSSDLFEDGSTSKSISFLGGIDVVADNDTSPDEWKTSRFGAAAGSMSVDTFVGGVDYTAGTTTALTLSSTTGSENNLWVSFDGVAQHKTEYSLSGTTLTFNEAIPVGVQAVEVQFGTTLSIGETADGTVSFVKLASSIIASVADMVAGTASKILTASNFKTWLDTYGRKKVYSATISNLDTAHDIESIFREGYNYTVVLACELGVAGVLTAVASDDNGVTYKTGASDYAWQRQYGVTGTAGDRDVADDNIKLIAYSQIINEPLRMEMFINDPVADTPTVMHSNASGNQGTRFFTQSWGEVLAANQINALRLAFDAGTGSFSEGTITVYEEAI